MINTILKFRLIGALFILLALNTTMKAQAEWDDVYFEYSGELNISSCLGNDEKIYSLIKFGTGGSSEVYLKKTNQEGSMEWNKDITSLMLYEADNTVSIEAYKGGFYGMASGANEVYVVGRKTTGISRGIILKSGFSEIDDPTIVETVKGGKNIIRDIQVRGDDMYIVGDFGDTDTPTSNIYFDNDQTQDLDGTFQSAFVAKFSIATAELIWSRVITANGEWVSAKYIDVDENGQIYISGEFEGNISFQTSSTGLNFLNSDGNGQNAFLVKLDTDGYKTGFNPKKRSSIGTSVHGGDVATSITHNAIYWGSNDLIAYDMTTGEAFSNWESPFANFDTPSSFLSVVTSDCDDLYATGRTNYPLENNFSGDVSDRSAVSCGSRFYAISLDPEEGDVIWSANATGGCDSHGTEVLVNADNKEVIIGNYNTDPSPDAFSIDDTYTGGTDVGSFIGIYNDVLIDQCCDDEIDLGEDMEICLGDEWPTFDLTGQIGNNHGITWFLNTTVVQIGGTSFTPDEAGTYSVYVEYGPQCAGYGSVQLTDENCCDQQVDLGEDITICKDDAWPILDVTGQIEDIVSIVWFYSESPFAVAANTEMYTTTGAGTYTVKVTYGNGCITSASVTITVENCPDNCNIVPNIKMKQKTCSISVSASLSTSGSNTMITGYLWDFGDGTTAVGVNANHSYTAAGTYILTLSVYGIGSDGECCVTTIQKQVVIAGPCYEKCEIKASMTASPIANQVYLFSSSSFSNGFTTIIGYEWTINGNVVSNEASFATQFQGGVVCLTVYGVMEDGECCDAKTCKSFSSGPNSELQSPGGFKLFPNPTSDYLKLDFEDFSIPSEMTTISIYDPRGVEIHSTSTKALNYEMNIASWMPGMYFCRVENAGNTAVEKFVKE